MFSEGHQKYSQLNEEKKPEQARERLASGIKF